MIDTVMSTEMRGTKRLPTNR